MEEVTEERFRPNIYIEGEFGAFAEDSWPHLRIGGATFRNVKLCTRCVYVTVAAPCAALARWTL